ncbi:MAG: hypothetical protein Q9216_005141 [Gyalolechia sp. 2 TL-2023]
MSSSNTAPNNRGNAGRARGRGNQTGRGRGGSPHGRGRGRGGHPTRGSGETHQSHGTGRGRPHDLSQREHTNPSIIPIERRHRIYLPLDNPPQQEGSNLTSPSGQQPVGDQDPGASTRAAQSEEGRTLASGKAVENNNNRPTGEQYCSASNSNLHSTEVKPQDIQMTLTATSGLNRLTFTGSNVPPPEENQLLTLRKLRCRRAPPVPPQQKRGSLRVLMIFSSLKRMVD